MIEELTQEIVKELLEYDPDMGSLTWKLRDRKWFKSDRDCIRWNKQFAGKPALASKNKAGYLHGSIFHKTYRAHRVIFLWQVGRWPDPEVDHLNHIRHDNRWSNLSEKDRSGQMRNLSLRRDNTSGHVGVYKTKYGMWLMAISDNKGCIYNRNFHSFEDAVAARKEAELKYGYHERHGEKKAA